MITVVHVAALLTAAAGLVVATVALVRTRRISLPLALLLDFFTADVVVPHGAPFLWPLSNAYYLSPLTPFAEIVIDPSGRAAFLKSLFTPDTARVWAGESANLLLAVGTVQVLRAWRLRPALRDAAEDL